MLKPDDARAPNKVHAALKAAGAFLLLALVVVFVLYRFGALEGEGASRGAPPPAEQVLQQLPERERQKAREQLREIEATPNPKPSAGS